MSEDLLLVAVVVALGFVIAGIVTWEREPSTWKPVLLVATGVLVLLGAIAW